MCAAPPEWRHYLCRLCKTTLSSHSIITHMLSLDHLHCYFVRNVVSNCVFSLFSEESLVPLDSLMCPPPHTQRKWHPAELMEKEAYCQNNRWPASSMLKFAEKTKAIHGPPSTKLQVLLHIFQ